MKGFPRSWMMCTKQAYSLELLIIPPPFICPMWFTRIGPSGWERINGVGHAMATAYANKATDKSPPRLIQGDFLDAVLPRNTFDAVWSHRVIHLLEDEYSVDAYRQRLADIIKDHGIALIAARDPRGVKPTREGHTVSFWDKARFQRVFEQNFTVEQIIQGEELESANNPVPTYFTLMVARRKPRML